MNLIGHNYIAKRVLGRHNTLIATGCHLPDIAPFVKDSEFSFEEIHESPEKVFTYLQKNNLDYLDLALGMLTHSVKFGADKFNRDIEVWLLDNNEKLKTEIAQMIVEMSGVSLEVAEGSRLHNYLWCGVDFYIIGVYPSFIADLKNAYKNVDVAKIAQILSVIFNKSKEKVQNNVQRLLSDIIKHDIKTKNGYVSFLKEFLSNLPEKDNIDVDKAVGVIHRIEMMFHNEWENIIDKVTTDTKLRIDDFYLNN